MRIVEPIDITGSLLDSTNVPFEETEWSAGTYSEGDRRVYGEFVYEVVAGSTSDRPDQGAVKETPTWVRLGYSNKWRIFREGVDSYSSKDGEIIFTITPGEFFTTAAFLNVSGRYIHIKVTDPTEGVVFEETREVAPEEAVGVGDWWEYFFTALERLPGAVSVISLPPYPSASIEFTIEPDEAADEVRIGRFIIGVERELGCTTYGTSVDIQDFSKKERDGFGNLVLLKRRTIKRVSYKIDVSTDFVDTIVKRLQRLSSIPTLFIGTEEIDSTIVFGVFQDVMQGIDTWSVSELLLQVEEF